MTRQSEHHVAILDLGTRATKAVVADRSRLLQSGFDWGLFSHPDGHTSATLNGVDDAVDAERHLHVGRLGQAVESIDGYLDRFRRFGVGSGDVYGFATGAIRGARNRDEVLQLLEDRTGVRFDILSGLAEARWSLLSAFLSLPSATKGGTIVIDQGGGSTEVSLGEPTSTGVDVSWTVSLGIGTGSLQRRCEHELPDAPLAEAYDFLRQHVRELCEDRLPPPPSQPARVVGMGSALRELRPAQSSRRQHGVVWTRKRLVESVGRCSLEHERYGRMTVSELLLEKQRLLRRRVRRNHADNALTVLVGMPVVLELMDRFGAGEIVFNGTGLRFGVCFAKCLGLIE